MYNRLDKSKLLIFLAIVSIFGGSLAACSTTDTSTTTEIPLVVKVPKIPSNLNPSLTAGANSVSKQIDSLLLPSAFYLDSSDNYTLNSNAVTSAEIVSVAPQVVLYNINPKAVWSDGHPLSALDFIYTWESQRSGASTATPPYMSSLVDPSRYSDIASVVSNRDGSAVAVTFVNALSSWRSLFNPIFPARYFQQFGFVASMSLGSTAFPTIGDMTIQSYSSNEVSLKAVTGAQSTFSEVDFVAQNYQNKSLGSMPTVQLSSNPIAATASPYYVNSGSLVEMYLNTKDTSTAMRNGIAYAINRSAIWDKIYGATPLGSNIVAPPGNNLYMPGENGYRDNQGYFVTQNLAKAERSFIQAGMSYSPAGHLTFISGTPVFTIAYQASSSLVTNIAQMIDQTLTKLGMVVILDPINSPNISTQSTSADAILMKVPNSGDPSLLALPFVGLGNISTPFPVGSITDQGLLNLAHNQVYPLDSSQYYNRLDSRIWNTMAGIPIVSPIYQMTSNYLFDTEELKAALEISTAGGAISSTPITIS